MKSLILREIQSFFSSLIGYTVVAVFLLMCGLFLWLFPGGWNVLDSGMASLAPLFAMAPWVLMFLIPAITMRSFAEEHRTGTLELLLTRPLTEGQVVLAKFLGAWLVSIAALLPTLSFVLVCVLTESCCTRVESLPTMFSHGYMRHVQPGRAKPENSPSFSRMPISP